MKGKKLVEKTLKLNVKLFMYRNMCVSWKINPNFWDFFKRIK